MTLGVSKKFEGILLQQMGSYFDHFFSDYQCSFRQGHRAPNCLISAVEKWKKTKDEGKNICSSFNRPIKCVRLPTTRPHYCKIKCIRV